MKHGHPNREETTILGRFEYESKRRIRLSEGLEIGTTLCCCGPGLFPLLPASVPRGGPRPSLCEVSVETDKIDKTSCSPTQFVTQFFGNPDKAARGVFDRQHRIVSIGPKHVVVSNVLGTLYGVAVDAAEQEVAPIELSFPVETLWSDVFHCQVGRQTPLAVAAIASQSLHEVANRVLVPDIDTRCGSAVNRPHFDFSVVLAKASSLRMAPRPGFAEYRSAIMR